MEVDSYNSHPSSTTYDKCGINLLWTYGQDILEFYLKAERKITNPLEFHKINDLSRETMIGWLNKISNVLERNERVFHLAVSIMDYYLIRLQKEVQLQTEQLHIIGVTALFIASKFEDEKHLSITQVIRWITHDKIDRARLLTMEIRMFAALNFNIWIVTAYDIIKLLLANMKTHSLS